MTETKADSIGYKRPPKEHQFRPGQSGNPGGRPKGARSFKSDLRDELSELTKFQDGGEQHTVSALIKRLVAWLAVCVREFSDTDEELESPEDLELVQAFTQRRGGQRQ
jgi:uncharacterized protein DUF5681